MRFDTLPQPEARFRQKAAPFLLPFSVDVPNENLTVHGQVFKPHSSDYFHAVEQPRQRIVVPFTAGNLRSDRQSLPLVSALASDEAIKNLFPNTADLPDIEETTDDANYHPNDFDEKPLPNQPPVTAPNVYALLIGINNYDRVGKLRGCLHDVDVVGNYLTQRTTTNVALNGDPAGKIKKLTDSQATRAGIIQGFREHLSQAKKGDTVLLYYSGHGTQEQADPIWDETDGLLECLVCYDGGATKASDFLMTDKELRFLIRELYQKTGAHIVTIFDCCHSGDNTRNAALVDAVYDQVIQRRASRPGGGAFPIRSWTDFLFSDTLTPAAIAGKKPIDFLRQGTHIQMAACESDQTAVEIAGEGIFTKTLLRTLTDSGGNISYNTLRSRVRQYMRVSYEQTPRVYAPVDAAQLLNTGFLNQTIDPQQLICEAIYTAKTGWQLNMGAIHGINEETQIDLIDPTDATKTIAVTIRKKGIFVDYTLLNETISLNQSAIYKAIASGLMAQDLTIELQNHDGNPKDVGELTAALQATAKGNFSFDGEKGAGEEQAKNEKDSGKARAADYTLHVRAGETYLTLPNDPYRPLMRPLPFVRTEDHKGVLDVLQHVSRWHFIRNLQNKILPNSFPEQVLKLELIRLMADGTATKISLLTDTAHIDYEQTGDAWKGSIQLKITNTTEQDLYVCAAYLSKEFQCFLDFLPQRVQLLQAGKSIFLGPKGKDRINLKLGRVEQEYNWPDTREAIKFIISTTEFDGEALTLDELPKPLTTNDIGKDLTLDIKRGLDTEDDVHFSGWMTQTLHLVFKNPVYDQIPPATIQALLNWEETAYFAAGLYCDVQLDEFGQPTVWQLKPTITKGLNVPEDERGVIDSLKLFLGNQIESAQRRKRYRNLKQDPNRLRIVAEGDSWFQYPILVEDTLDHLYKLYAIRSFAEAGDTLENYMKKRTYVDAIQEEGATFFLVSGGGNDILGEQFEGFLRDVPDTDDTTCQRYFKPNLAEKLTTLEGFYEEMFRELLTRYDDLHILVHSYDYVLPVDTDDPANKGKSSWLGKYMIRKKIQPQKEREACIHFVIDAFNDRLKTAVAKMVNEFGKRVSYIDVRTVVNRSSWFDEIHPTNEGFQLVADKFIAEIEQVRAEKKKSINDIVQLEMDFELAPVMPADEPSPFRPGQLNYDIPDMMTLGKPATCLIRIGDMDVKNITISSTSLHASIEICDEMSVKLLDLSDGESFKLIPITTERQSIENGKFTEWKISVKPLQEGTFPLLLRVSCHFDGRTKDVEVLEKSVFVSADPTQTNRNSKKKIVFIAAGSKSGLLLGKESNEIWEELLMSPFCDDFLYVKFFEVTTLQFNRALSFEKPSIVHFSGHGSVEGIFLADERGEPQLATRQDMAGLFKVLQIDGIKIECVVLNACLSRDLAEDLSNCVPTVIGTNTKIGDDKAIQFSEFFYRALGNRRTYQQAFDLGKVKISSGDEGGISGEELLMCLVR